MTVMKNAEPDHTSSPASVHSKPQTPNNEQYPKNPTVQLETLNNKPDEERGARPLGPDHQTAPPRYTSLP